MGSQMERTLSKAVAGGQGEVGSPTFVCRCNRHTKKKKMGQMKEQIKAPENIQLSDKEIASLSDAEFKTLVIRVLKELVAQ